MHAAERMPPPLATAANLGVDVDNVTVDGSAGDEELGRNLARYEAACQATKHSNLRHRQLDTHQQLSTNEIKCWLKASASSQNGACPTCGILRICACGSAA